MNTCPDCKKEYKNLLLHIVKTHKKALCVSCEKWVSLDDFITELGGEKKNKKCYAGMCKECFT
jgi:hypothetical protein